MDFDRHTELQLMEALETEPETSQADLAAQVGVAVGTVNWYIKRWTAKGFVIVKRMDRWRWRYLLTPKGLAEKADLANRYFQASMRIYRESRTEVKQHLSQVKAAGYDAVVIEGEGDIAEICQLTCLEQGIKAAGNDRPDLPRLQVNGYRVELQWPTGTQEAPANVRP